MLAKNENKYLISWKLLILTIGGFHLTLDFKKAVYFTKWDSLMNNVIEKAEIKATSGLV